MSVPLSLLHFSNVLSLLRRRFCARVLCGLSEVDDGGSERREILCFIHLFFFIGLSLLPLSFFFWIYIISLVSKKSEKEEEERREVSKKEKRRDELFFCVCGNRRVIINHFKRPRES